MSNDLAERILNGDIRALAQAISLVENGDRKVRPVLKSIYTHTGEAHVIGVTGAAGTGKSTLIDRLTAEYRRRGKSVGILAVDPSSPFTKGAVLGDRIRMREHYLDERVFIRSFATRGYTGGVAAAVADSVHLLDAAGKNVIFVETIGVGQDELDIAGLADTVIVVLMPQTGDDVQGIKAGFVEIADILVVNKADIAGASQMLEQLKALFGGSHVVIAKTSALHNEGIKELADMLEQQRAKRLANGSHRERRLELCRQELLTLLQAKILTELTGKIGADSFQQRVKLVAERRLDPYSAVDEIAKKIGL